MPHRRRAGAWRLVGNRCDLDRHAVIVFAGRRRRAARAIRSTIGAGSASQRDVAPCAPRPQARSEGAAFPFDRNQRPPIGRVWRCSGAGPLFDINEAATDAWLGTIIQRLSDDRKDDLKGDVATRGQVCGAVDRIDLIAPDIAERFRENFAKLHVRLKAHRATDGKFSAIRSIRFR